MLISVLKDCKHAVVLEFLQNFRALTIGNFYKITVFLQLRVIRDCFDYIDDRIKTYDFTGKKNIKVLYKKSHIFLNYLLHLKEYLLLAYKTKSYSMEERISTLATCRSFFKQVCITQDSQRRLKRTIDTVAAEISKIENIAMQCGVLQNYGFKEIVDQAKITSAKELVEFILYTEDTIVFNINSEYHSSTAVAYCSKLQE